MEGYSNTVQNKYPNHQPVKHSHKNVRMAWLQIHKAHVTYSSLYTIFLCMPVYIGCGNKNSRMSLLFCFTFSSTSVWTPGVPTVTDWSCKDLFCSFLFFSPALPSVYTYGHIPTFTPYPSPCPIHTPFYFKLSYRYFIVFCNLAREVANPTIIGSSLSRLLQILKQVMWFS
jgi:hypothetical protein